MTANAFIPSRRSRRRRGSAAVVAIAVVILVGFFGAALLSGLLIDTSTATSHALGAQAYYIADAGIEWACKQDSETSVPTSFGNGTFEVSAEGGLWVSVGIADMARRTIRCGAIATLSISEGLDYVLGSRQEHHSKIIFFLMNNSDSPIVFDRIRLSWDSPAAYAEKMQVDVENYNDYKDVWRYENDDGTRWTNGQTRVFTETASVTVPVHYTAEIKAEKFAANPDGTGAVDLNSTTMTVDLYNGSTHVAQFIIDPPVQP